MLNALVRAPLHIEMSEVAHPFRTGAENQATTTGWIRAPKTLT
jgi:hypothetical protein